MATEDSSSVFRYNPGQDWFSGHIPVLHPFLDEARGRAAAEGRPVRVLELGSLEGRSAVGLALELGGERVEGSSSSTSAATTTVRVEMVCVDHFDLEATEEGRKRLQNFEHNIGELKKLVPCNVRLVKKFTLPALWLLLAEQEEKQRQHQEQEKQAGGSLPFSGPFDVVYVDASHRSDDTLLDAELAWRLADANCLFIFDDYEWPAESNTSMSHPKRGIDAFVALHNDEVKVLNMEYQVLLRKLVPQRIGFLSAAQSETEIWAAADWPIIVAFCVDSNGVLPCAAALRSIQESSHGHRIVLFVGSMGLSKDEKDTLKQAAPKLSNSLQFVELDMAAMTSNYPPPVAVWGKLELLQIMPAERVIVLDADVLVLSDLLPLWETPLQGCLLGAVRDEGYPSGTPQLQEQSPELWGKDERYFNAGVLLVDLTALRLKVPQLLALARDRAADFPVGRDQDVLNLFLRGQWTELGLRWDGTYLRSGTGEGALLKKQ